MKHFSKSVVLIANSGFTIINFRSELIVKLVALNCHVLVLCPQECPLMLGRDIKSELSELGAYFHPINLNRSGINPFADLGLLFSLWKFLYTNSPDIVLNYTVKPTIYGSIAARLAGVKTISSNITGIGSILAGKTLKNRSLAIILKSQYWVALRVNSIVFFQNPDDRDFFVLSGLTKKTRVKVINGSGINISQFYRKNLEPTKASFIFVGRLLRGKGIAEYINAAEILKAKYPEALFTILGDTDENPESLSEADVSRYNAQGIVNYCKATKDVRPALDQHQVLVLPSYREGTPRSVLEALAMSMAIVTTDAPGCRETVIDGVNGYLVDVGSVSQLVEAMERFILDPQLAELFGIKSRELACTKYNVEKVVDTILVELPLSSSLQ
jgi:glycosyltransferase involved in cell wall biosynthesis